MQNPSWESRRIFFGETRLSMPIYTKTGDKGKTSLFSGKRVWKDNIRVEAYGTIDELNSIIGVAISHLKPRNKNNNYLKTILVDVQKTLFYLGSYLADLPDTIENTDINQKVEEFEHQIDSMTKKMPTLSNFILPGGGVAGAALQHARTVARRAERNLVSLSKKEEVDARVVKYINRLSDLLFTAARFANYADKKKETIWER